MNKIHLFDYEHFEKFPVNNTNRRNATKCGYVRDNITHDKKKVNCKLCLREMKKEGEE
jgi:hypothetical protein